MLTESVINKKRYMKKVGTKNIENLIEAKRIENIKNERKDLSAEEIRNSRKIVFQTPSIKVDFSKREVEKDKDGNTVIKYRLELLGMPDLLEYHDDFEGKLSSTVFKANFTETELILTSKKYAEEQIRNWGFQNRVENKAIEMVIRILATLKSVQASLLRFNMNY